MTMRFRFTFTLYIVLLCTNGKVLWSAPPVGVEWSLIPELSDEFDVVHHNPTGDGLDTTKWWDFHPTWTGRLPSQFSADNTWVQDGKLNLRSTSLVDDMSEVGDPFTEHWVDSAVITSRAEAHPGDYFEASIKTANLSMPSSWWFRQGSKSEIDVIENIGQPSAPNLTHLESAMAYNTHFYDPGPNTAIGGFAQMTDPDGDPLLSRENFITYGVWWKSPTELRFYYNDTEVATVTPAGAFDEGLNMIFDMEVFRWAGLPMIDSLNDPSRNTMQVDWVRGYRPTHNPGPPSNLVDNPSFEQSHPGDPTRPDLWADCGNFGCENRPPFESRSAEEAHSGSWSLQVDNSQPNSFTQYKEIRTRDSVYSVLPGDTVRHEVWVKLTEEFAGSNETFALAMRLNGNSSQPRTGAGQVVLEDGTVVAEFTQEINAARELNINSLFGGENLNRWVKVEYAYEIPTTDGTGKTLDYITSLSFIDNKSLLTPNQGVLYVDDFSLEVISPLPGDFNGDGILNHLDLDELAANVGSANLIYDLNGDGNVTFVPSFTGVTSDSDYLVRTLLNTQYGDANLDGKVDILDLDQLGQGYQGAGTGWLFGDFDGSGGTTDVLDLDLLGQLYGFGDPSSLAIVPEPSTFWLALTAASLAHSRIARRRIVHSSGENRRIAAGLVTLPHVFL